MKNYNCEIDNYSKNLYTENSIDICPDDISESEIKLDIILKKVETIRIWGQVKDCNGNSMPDVLLKLIKKCDCGYMGIANTISDCQGFYQFELYTKDTGAQYKIIANKINLDYAKTECSSNCHNYSKNKDHCLKKETVCSGCYQKNEFNDRDNINYFDDYLEITNCANQYNISCNNYDLCRTCKHFNEKLNRCTLK